MPDFPATGAPRKATKRLTVGLIDWTGKKSTSFLSVPGTATDVQLDTLRQRIGEGTNAAVWYSNKNAEDTVLRPQTLTAFDEAEARVTSVAIFQFIDENGNVEELPVPAPDSVLFSTVDPELIDPASARSAAIIAAALAALNSGDPAGTFVFSRGYLATRRKGRGAPSQKTIPAFAEPGGAELPGPGGGT